MKWFGYPKHVGLFERAEPERASRTRLMMNVTREGLLTCCACPTWAEAVYAQAPSVASFQELVDYARHVWWNQTPVEGWLQAFAAHPKLGDAAALRRKYGEFAEHSAGEQAGLVQGTPDALLLELADWNQRYEQRFGHIFILSAAGKGAVEVLEAIKARSVNTPLRELQNAAAEQMVITERRLAALFGGATTAPQSVEPAARRTGQLLGHLAPLPAPARPAPSRAPITSHVLDTTLGRPASQLLVQLWRLCAGSNVDDGVWSKVGEEATDADGRVSGLLPAGSALLPGTYRVVFCTGPYLRAQHSMAAAPAEPFYPSATVDFHVPPSMSGQHFHIPLLLNPFAYSTYRGS